MRPGLQYHSTMKQQWMSDVSKSSDNNRQFVKLASHQEDQTCEPFQVAWQTAPGSPALQTEPRGNERHDCNQQAAQVSLLKG